MHQLKKKESLTIEMLFWVNLQSERMKELFRKRLFEIVSIQNNLASETIMIKAEKICIETIAQRVLREQRAMIIGVCRDIKLLTQNIRRVSMIWQPLKIELLQKLLLILKISPEVSIWKGSRDLRIHRYRPI